MMEKRLSYKSNLLTVDEIRDDLSLRFERLSPKTHEKVENEDNQDDAYFEGQLKEKCRHCGVIKQAAVK
jgi:hypothetical protein